jgi:thioredoxin:protein disulfide reductase
MPDLSRIRRLLLVAFLAGVLLPLAAGAQDGPLLFFGQQDIPSSSADLVAIETYLSQDAVEPGGEIQAAVLLDIADTWHINSHRPLQDYLIATSLDFESRSGVIIAEIQYPQHDLQRFAFAQERLAVYDGRVPIFLTLRVAERVEAAEVVLDGRLRIQACNDEICLSPATVDVPLVIPVADPGMQVAATNADVFVAYDPFSRTLEGNEIADMFADGWILAFLGIFVIGLALNLTPCVYPMLSVTVSLFGGQEATGLGRSFGRASMYVFGIIVMYAALGVAAAFTGSLFGAWLQSPWVLGGIGILLLALALSMFGFYDLQLPSSWTTRLGAANRVTGFAGLFLSGLVVGIFAAPCVGPPVIALLAFVGGRGDPLFGLSVFGVLAFGLGLPYLILGTFSSLLSKLPRSGVWMVWVKKVFGVVLVGAALFYIGLAFNPQVAMYAVVAALVIGGIYLGFIERSGAARSVFRKVQWVVGSVAIIAGALMFMALLRPGIEWEPFSLDRLDEAMEAGQPVMLDFYADWCIPCIELDRVTFTDGRVIDATGDFVRLKVDLTAFDSDESEAIRGRFDVAGVPTIVFLDESGDEVTDARIIGFLGPRPFLERVERVRTRVVADVRE